MKLAMTLVVRDEADVLDAQISFHLASGVDVVVAIDNGSTDGTHDILTRFERCGALEIVKEDRPFDQPRFVTRLAAIVAERHRADWVIHSDADEFWFPRSGTLKDALVAVPPRFGLVHGLWRHFVPVFPENGHFAERMVFRIRPGAPGTTARDPYHPQVKVVHRARSGVAVGVGNHNATGGGLTLLRGWYPFDVLHFPLRSRGQFEQKTAQGHAFPEALHRRAAVEAIRGGRLDDRYRMYARDEAAIEHGVRAGWLVEDTRVRDALRRLAGVPVLTATREFEWSPDRRRPLVDHPPPAVAWDAGRACDAAALPLSHERWQSAIEQLERRVASLERQMRRPRRARARAGRSRPAT